MIAFDRKGIADKFEPDVNSEEECAEQSRIREQSNSYSFVNYTYELAYSIHSKPIHICTLFLDKSVKEQRWKSDSFRLFSSARCENKKEVFDTCTLKDYLLI